MSDDAIFWADQLAENVLDTFADEDVFVCASGISPSGPVHIGNFREIITTDFVVKALKRKGVDVRFIYSWDDFDRFRKVPAGIPAEFERYIGKPLSEVPDPEGEYESYAERFESALEDEIAPLMMDIEFIRQHGRFEDCVYADRIKTAMNNRDTIREILDEYRREPLEEEWYPLRVYCPHCGKDFTVITGYDGEYTVTYECSTCEDSFELDFSETGAAKPPWRVDWPMRWDYESVAFEPGGKDHSAPGSSRDTGKQIVEAVYGRDAPVYQMYEFVNLQGRDGKMSSSSGDVMTPGELLDVYTPAVLRYVFAGTKPASEIAIALDDGIVPVYKKFDEIEEAYFNPETMDNDRKREHWKRVYELSIVDVPEAQPVRIDFDHAAFVAQTVPRDEWRTKGLDVLRTTGHIDGALSDEQEELIIQRLQRAATWAETYAPEDYVYEFNTAVPDDVRDQLSEDQVAVMQELHDLLDATEYAEKDTLEDDLFTLARESDVSVGNFFQAAYLCLLSREQGPRLAEFILTRGQHDVIKVLNTLK